MAAFLSAEEAAAVCGVSTKTVRRWVKSGKLTAAKRGRSFRIAHEDLQPFIGQNTAQIEDTQDTGQRTPPIVDIGDTGQGGMVGLVRELKDELVQKAEAAAMWQARAEMLAGELHQAREQLALQAPAEQPQPAAAPTATEAGEQTSWDAQTQQRPWWRRWFGL